MTTRTCHIHPITLQPVMVMAERRDPYMTPVIHDDDLSQETRNFYTRASVSSNGTPVRGSTTPEPPSPIADVLPAAQESTPPDHYHAATPRRSFKQSPPVGPTKPNPFHNLAHHQLLRCCELHETPADLSPVMEPVQPFFGLPKVFYGQLPREMNTQHVRWLLRDLLGITPYDIRPAGAGCFVIQLMSQQDAAQALSLHRRVLYDNNFMYWFARERQQQDWLDSYADSVLSTMRGGHLPTNCMVAEWATERRFARRH